MLNNGNTTYKVKRIKTNYLLIPNKIPGYFSIFSIN